MTCYDNGGVEERKVCIPFIPKETCIVLGRLLDVGLLQKESMVLGKQRQAKPPKAAYLVLETL